MKSVGIEAVPQGWECVRLRVVAEIISGQSPEGKYYNEKQIGLPFYQGKTEFGKIFIKKAKKWTSKTTKVAEKNDILMSVRAPVGPVNFATEKICIGRGLASIKGNSRISQEFLFYLLQGKEKDIQGNVGSTFASINRGDIQKIKILLPPLLEQKAIASFLKKWDEAIETIGKLIDTTEKQLQGLQMSLLSPPEPCPEDWECLRLGDIGEFCGGVTSIGREDYGYGTPFISYLNVYSNPKVDINSLELMNVSSGDIKRLKCQYGDTFFTSSSEAIDEVAVSSVLLDLVDNLTFNGFCKRLRLKNFNNLLPEYARYLFRSSVFRDSVRVKVTGSTRFNINQHELEKIVISTPSLPEQEVIVAQLEVWETALANYKKLKEKYILQKQVFHTKLLNGEWRLNCD